MTAFRVKVGDPNAVKKYSAYVFVAVQKGVNFMNLLSGPPPKVGNAAQVMKGQSSASYPIVKLIDTASGAGDEVIVDLVNTPRGKPVMGDKQITGKSLDMSFDSAKLRIDQSRGLVNTPGRMSQKRTVHNFRDLLKPGMEGWAMKVEQQRVFYHLAGARGDETKSYLQIPLASDPDFSEIMVNRLVAPTFNRRYFASAGGITSISQLTEGDILTLGDVSRIAAQIDEADVPMNPPIYREDPYGFDDPIKIMFVTRRQWELMKLSAGSMWQSAVSAAVKRFDGNRHPLFNGDMIMWAGVLIKPMSQMACRFSPGSVITEATNSPLYTETQGQVPGATNFYVDRAIIIGAQALIKAYGDFGEDTGAYFWNEELTDHKAKIEVSLAMMEGASKVRFRVDGEDWDLGVATVDSYAPPPDSAQFQTALALTKK